MSKYYSIAILLSIILLAFILRIYNIHTSPSSLYWDEVSLGYEAYSIAETGKDTHGNSWLQAFFPAYGDYKAPMYIWLTSIWLKFFPLSILTTKITSILSGSLLVYFVYLVACELFAGHKYKVLAYCAALFTAISPWSIQFSRAAFEANLALLFGLASVWAMFHSRKQPQWIIACSVLGACSIYSYISNRFVLPLLFIAIFLIECKKYIANFKWIIAGLVLFITLIIPIFISSNYRVSNQYRLSTDSVLQNSEQILRAQELRDRHDNSILSRVYYHRYWLTAKEALINLSDHLTLDFLFLRGDPNLRHSTGFTGVMFPFMIIFFSISLITIWKHDFKIGVFLISAWLVSLVPAIIPQSTPHALRSLNALPWIIILTSWGFFQVIKIKSLLYKLVLLSILTAWALFDVGSYCYYYFYDYPLDSQKAWSLGYSQTAEYVTLNHGQYDSVHSTIGDNFFNYILFALKYDPKHIQQISAESKFNSPFDLRILRFDKFVLNSSLQEIMSQPGKVLAIIKIEEMPKDANILATFPMDNANPEFAIIKHENNYK